MSSTHNDTIIVLIRHPESESNVHLHKHEDDLADDVSDQIRKSGDPNISLLGKKQADRTVRHLYRKFVDIDISNHKGNTIPDLEIMYSNCTRTHYIAHHCHTHFQNMKEQDLDYGNSISQPIMLSCLQEYTEPGKGGDGDGDGDGGVPDSFIIDQSPVDFIGRVYDDFISKRLVIHQKQTNTLTFYFGHSLYWSLVLSMIVYQNQEPMQMTKEDMVSRLIDHNTGEINTVFEIPNCSITTLRYHSAQKKWKILGFGKNDHLDHLATGTHSVF